MKFGICCAPNALGEPAHLLEIMQSAGADYVEWTIGSLMASDAEFEKLQGVVANSALKPEAFCVFLPPHHRITGPDVNLGAVLEYADEALRRASALGGEIVVLGSGAARKVPAGFSMDEALAQFTRFARELGPIAQNHGVTMTIEPLNKGEDNLVNTVSHGAQIVDAVNHPNIQLLADFYHMFTDDEPISNVHNARARIKHAHLADLNRVAPSFSKEGEADFVGFFGALKAIGYDERISFEGKTEDLAAQARAIIAHMKLRHSQA